MPPQVSEPAILCGLLEKFGTGCFSKLLGDFACVVWDSRTGTLFAARDAFGLRPFFYARARHTLAFACEVRALLAVPGVSRAPDEHMAAEFLLWWSGYTDIERTFFREIKRLPPAHFLEWDGAQLRVERYWQLDTQRRIVLPRAADYADQLKELLSEAVRCRMHGSRKCGVFLSGGIDSGAILAAASTHAFGRVAAYTGKIPGESDESEMAGAVAAHFAVKQSIVLPPQAGLSEIAPSTIARNASPICDLGVANERALLAAAQAGGCDTVLTGDGGDELFGTPVAHVAEHLRRGWFLRLARILPHVASYQSTRPGVLLRRALELLVPEVAQRLWRSWKWRVPPPWIATRLAERIQLQGLLRQSASKPRFDSLAAREDYYGFVRPRRVLMDEARELEAAYAGVHLTFPFYDRRLVEFMFALPPGVRTQGRSGKGLLLACGWLPEVVQSAERKAGYGSYFEGELQRTLAVLAGRMRPAGARDFVREEFLRANPNLAAEQPLTLWAICRFLLWMQSCASVDTAVDEKAAHQWRAA